MRRETFLFLVLAIVVSAGWPKVLPAKNVDLVTLPSRNSVQLTIYNSEDLTLVKESRTLTLKRGRNQLQFSWAGTLIDPTSVTLRPTANAVDVEVVDTIFPGQKPQHLIWNIDSDIEGEVPVEVSYFTSGLTWRMDYVAIKSADGATLDLTGHVRVFNASGEAYENAEIRMIVGNINLVEKIAKLARISGLEEELEESKSVRLRLRRDAVVDSIDLAGAAYAGRVVAGKKTIVKEGLSEYFMFAIEGTETVDNGWSKRMQSVQAKGIDFDTVYRVRAHQYGPRPVQFLILKNDEDHDLGDSPLPNGVIRVFQRNGREGLGFQGQQKMNYVPIRADIEVNLGADDLVVHERLRGEVNRSNFDHHPVNRRVRGWDESQAWLDTIRNYRSKPIKVELQFRYQGDFEIKADESTSLFSFNTIERSLSVEPLGKQEYSTTVLQHHGENAKQARVRLTK